MHGLLIGFLVLALRLLMVFQSTAFDRIRLLLQHTLLESLLSERRQR